MNNQIVDFVKIMIDYNESKDYIKGLKSDIQKNNNNKELEKNKKYFSVFDNGDVIIIDKQLLSLCKNTSSCIHKSLKLVLFERINNTVSQFWPILANIAYNMQQQQGYFQGLLNLKEFPQYFRDTINKDVLRTTGNETMRTKLTNVLNAYTIRNAQIGYCQGFNYIAHYLLEAQNLSEEVSNDCIQETFWFLCYLFETILPPNYYNHLFGVLSDDEIIKKILTITKPKLMKHLQNMSVETSLFTIQWLVCCFTFHNKLSETILDLLLLEGSKALIKAALTYVTIFEDHILETQDIGSLIVMIEHFTSTFQDRQTFLQEYNKIYINNKLLQFARQDISNNVVNLVQSSDHRKVIALSSFLEDLKKQKCNSSDPICVQVLESWTRNKQHLDSIVFSYASINVIDDYQRKQQNRLSFKQSELIMVRQNHICQKDDGFLIRVLQHKDTQEAKNLYIPKTSQVVTTAKSPIRARSPVKDLLLIPIKALDKSQHIGQRLRMNPKIYKIDMNPLSSSTFTIPHNIRTLRLTKTSRGRSPQYKKLLMKKMNLYGSPKRMIDQSDLQMNQSTDISQQNQHVLLRESKSIQFLLQLHKITDLVSIDFQQN